MIDIWMIFTMLYPFCVVTLFAILEFLKEEDQTSLTPFSDRKDIRNNKTIRGVTFMLDYGLPITVIIFITLFWVLGLTNTSAPTTIKKSC